MFTSASSFSLGVLFLFFFVLVGNVGGRLDGPCQQMNERNNFQVLANSLSLFHFLYSFALSSYEYELLSDWFTFTHTNIHNN